ncbi:hypothetical protein O7631_25630 [Micromonospora sp. WMMD967]|uniref:hypothetical protein n=1 Tax=Micromonospora sp. WMMD967 TaxID=3016101 RepID=UPI0024165210|nr:hypothetical protein [Micromonospora sp. WMMD967]MDG4839924.1 hypothetical protein [Micromonospora sp. WMMD967]
MPDDAGDVYATRINAYRRELSELRTSPPRTDAIAECRVDTAHGPVIVTAAGGRLRSVKVAASMMRLSGADLSPPVMDAANSALADTRVELSDGGLAPDLSVLGGSLAEVLAESELAMHRLQGALAEAVAKVGATTGLGGDPSATGTADLLHGVLDLLGPMPGPDQMEDGEHQRIGTDDAGRALAEVDGIGQIVRLELTPEAGRSTSAELGESIVEAVNRAVDDYAAAADAASHGLIPEDLGVRAAELQEASLRQMAALTGALTGMMARIREP